MVMVGQPFDQLMIVIHDEQTSTKSGIADCRPQPVVD
jgi:hypothetical protein